MGGFLKFFGHFSWN